MWKKIYEGYCFCTYNVPENQSQLYVTYMVVRTSLKYKVYPLETNCTPILREIENTVGYTV